ncbi:MAG: hypothetical protein CMG74_13175 [Candidatus Marinimicrobia bacterium]|nr:hypothetical protein [Candidatus Neomarinimicrobiota bacterium]|tara:strand:- start:724 stop:1728 length:1005 start_codon:yes stop_codon:yes gene_type:complete
MVKLLLNYYSFGYGAGYADKTLPLSSQLSITSFVKLALENNLVGIELPFEKLIQTDANEITLLRNKINENKLEVLISIEDFSPSLLFSMSNFLNKNDIKCNGKIRVKMSNNFGGNRYKINDFDSQIQKFTNNLIEADEYCAKMGYKLGIENHQDLTSYELIDIIESNNLISVGINWDVGNSFALGQSPKDFYNVIKNHIINVHLKDYIIVKSNLGSELVRCPLGVGVVNFAETINDIRLLDAKKNNLITMSIELGAHTPRNIDYFHAEYWEKFPKAIQTGKKKFIQYMKSINSENLNRGENNLIYNSPPEIIKKEIKDAIDSIHYIKSLLKKTI